MLSSRLYGVEDLRREEIPTPEPGPGEVIVRVAHNGICGTDLRHYYHQGPVRTVPQPLGHEFSGVVTEMGSGVSDRHVGERVAVCGMVSCGQCWACRHGHTNICTGPGAGAIGCGLDSGGLSEYVAVAADLAMPLTPSLSLDQGALVEPMAVAFNGVLRSRIQPGEQAVVVGGGPIGVGVFLGLRAIGVTDITVVEPAVARQRVARGLGIDHVVDPRTESVADAVRSATENHGADVVFICASPPDVFVTAGGLVGSRGRIVMIATFLGELPFVPSELLRHEAEIVSARGYTPAVFEQVIGAMNDGHYPLNGWVEHISWDAIVTDGLEPLLRGERMKILVDVGPV